MSQTIGVDSSAEPPLRILMVCTGNVCRSPMAQYWLRSSFTGEPAIIESAGTGALVGNPMDLPSRAMTERFGGDPRDHVARQLDEHQLAAADLVIAMSREHRDSVLEIRPSMARRAFTIIELERLIALARFSMLRARVDSIDATPRVRLNLLLDTLAARRSDLRQSDGVVLDVADPYRRGDAAVERTAAQLLPAVESVAELVRTALR